MPADRQVATGSNTGNSLTFSHTVAGAAGRVLYVAVTSFRSQANRADPTSVTFNGVALTKIANFVGGSGNDNPCSLWRLINPAATTANIVVTHSQPHDITAASVSYSGADQTTPNDTVQVLDSASTTPSHAVASATGDQVASFMLGWNWDDATAGGGLTERAELDNGSGINSIAIGDAPGAASVTCAWTGGGFYNDPHGLFSFNINAAAGAVHEGAATLAGSATTAPSGRAVLAGAATVTAPATMAGTAFATRLAAAALLGRGSVNATGWLPGAATPAIADEAIADRAIADADGGGAVHAAKALIRGEALSLAHKARAAGASFYWSFHDAAVVTPAGTLDPLNDHSSDRIGNAPMFQPSLTTFAAGLAAGRDNDSSIDIGLGYAQTGGGLDLPVGAEARTIMLAFQRAAAGAGTVASYGTTGTTRQSFGMKVVSDTVVEFWAWGDDHQRTVPSLGTSPHVLAAVYDGASTVRLYVDGAQAGADIALGGALNTIDNGAGIVLGIDYFGTSNRFEGQLDEVLVFPAELSAAQIAEYARWLLTAPGLAVGSYVQPAAATMAGAATISATGTVGAGSAANLQGQASVSAAGVVMRLGASTAAGAAALSAMGTVLRQGAAALAGQGALTAVGHPVRLGAAAVAGQALVAGTSVVYVLATGAVAGVSSAVTGSITPGAGRRIVLIIANRRFGGASAVSSVTGNGLTWALVLTNGGHTGEGFNQDQRITVYQALGAAPTPGSITINFGGVTQEQVTWIVLEFSGYDRVIQSGQNRLVSAAQTLAVTLAPFRQAEHYAVGAFIHDGPSAFTPGDGFFVLASGVGALINLKVEFKGSADTSIDASYSLSTQALAVGLEVGSLVFVATISGQGGITTNGAALRLAAAALPGQATISATGRGTTTGVATLAGAGAINAAGRRLLAAQAAVTGSAGVVTAGLVSKPASAAVAGLGAINATGTASVPGQVATIAGLGAVSALARLLVGGLAALSGQGSLNGQPRLIHGGMAVIIGLGQLIANSTRIRLPAPRLVRVDVYDRAGNRLGYGPLVGQLAAEYGQDLDQLGYYSFTIPATLENADLLEPRRIVWIYREGEGLVFRGLVEQLELRERDAGAELEISGRSIVAELADRKMYGREWEGAPLATVGSDLVAGTSVAVGTLDVPASTLTMRGDGVSRWAAAVKVSQQFGIHAREDVLAGSGGALDISAFGTVRPLLLRNVDVVDPELADNADVGLVSEVSRSIDASGIINRVYALGAGEGNAQLHLGYSDRAAPYARVPQVQPDGRTLYYIEDAASQAAYGLVDQFVTVKEALPLANSDSGFLAMGNALYDIAADYLTGTKDPITTYAAKVVGLRHLDGAGAYRFEVGDKLGLWYTGIAHDEAGPRAYLNVNAQLWLMGYSRRFRPDGSDDWTLKVATADRAAQDGAAKLSKAIEDFYSIKVSQRPYSYMSYHGPFRDSLAPSFPMPFVVDYDANVFLLHAAKLQFRVRGLRANTTTASAGGSTSPTTSSGGGSTSSTGTSHSHSVSGTTSSGGGSHGHSVTATASENPSTWSFWVSSLQNGIGGFTDYVTTGDSHNHSSSTTDAASGHAHTVSGGTGTYGPHDHQISANFAEAAPRVHTHQVSGQSAISVGDHSHSVSGSTSGGEASHTHSISAHTHSVTIPDHTHGLVYGIFQQVTPGSPGITISINGVDRTAALGGPWNAGAVLDITQYLVNANGQPLRQDNTISLGAALLCDIEVVVRSLASATSLLPV